jgi:exodeoxyribonuclease VII large subunit
MADDRQPVEAVLSVSDFVAVFNQTIDYAYPSVTISGELANFRISKNRWVYFDLKDELSTLKFFGTVQQLPGPLEDGMLLKVRGQPRLHHLYGFSVNVMKIQPAGEGTIRRAAQLLQAKLQAEGLFDESRKRGLPYPPARIGLVTSKQSAAYADFIKVLNERWRGVSIEMVDVQVQGDSAPEQITVALSRLNELPEPPDVVVLVRGGGSAEDLAAFNSEAVTRSVAASRVPTLVAIGHEVDISLAELAADQRASTPSNAAELLVPDRRQVLAGVASTRQQLEREVIAQLSHAQAIASERATAFATLMDGIIGRARQNFHSNLQLLTALSPEAVLRRGYAIVRHGNQALRSSKRLATGAIVDIQLIDGRFQAAVTEETE